jgi:hypothetical protein
MKARKADVNQNSYDGKLLGGLPDKMRVQSDPGVEISAKNRWRPSQADDVARESGDHDTAAALSDSTVKVSKATGAKRATPKP